jgi:hypothetical protein
MTDYRPRTAVGYTGDQKVIMFVTNHMMIEQVAETLLGLGCYEAINLDGGGSSAIAAGNQSLYDQARAVPTILAIVHSDSLNIPKVPTFEKFIDTSDEGVTSQGSWFPTSNPGSWGSPSMLHGLATHDQYFNFPLNLPAAAEYEIHAWWTSHPNRSANTPFFISHADGVTEVAVNQTTNGSVWNLIGTFSFTGNTLESVRITAGATTNQYVVADAIRVVSYDTLVNVSVFSPTKSDVSVKIYPNPGTGLFMVQDQKNSDQNIFIYSTDGRLIHSSRLTGLFEHEVDLSRQPAGIYFLRLSDSETNRFYKLIISR